MKPHVLYIQRQISKLTERVTRCLRQKMVLKCSVKIMCIQTERKAEYKSKVKGILCKDVCESFSYLRRAP